MPKISITSLKKEIFCEEKRQTVLAAIQDNSIDWMHACGAKGRCTTCSMVVIEGQNNLSDMTKNELYYHKQAILNENERMACQCTLMGDIVIKIPYSNRLPHLRYYD